VRARAIAGTVGLAAALSATGLVAPALAQNIEPRVVGGEPTTTAEYPWQAALVYDSRFSGDDFQRQFCAGSLVTPRIVQTAAHCVFDGDPDDPSPPAPSSSFDHDDLDVILGRTTLTSGGGEELDVKGDVLGVHIHDGYDPATRENDLAWIVLASDSAQTPIKLAGPGESALWDPGSPTEVSGWGVDESGQASDVLRVATVPIVSDPLCADVYGAEFFPASMICAGYTSGVADACFGDSGGPLQAPSQGGEFRLIGGVSWGVGCSSLPGVYSRAVDFDLQAKIEEIESDEALTPYGEPVVGSGAVPPPPPPNDAFAAAENLGTSFASGASGDNFDATLELGEPNHGGGGASVWFRWVAPTTGSTTISLCESNFDTLLAVYGGGAVDSLGAPVAANDDSCGLASAATFSSVGGKAYRIAVDGFGESVGAVELSLDHLTDPPAAVPQAPVTTPPPVAKKCPKGKKLKKGKCVKKKKGKRKRER
jgi:hypothetical protein